VVIDISDVGDVGLEVVDHPRYPLARFNRIDRAKCQLSFSRKASAPLEISEWDKVAVVGRHRTAVVRHGKQGDLMTSRPHQFHGVKQVCFGPAEAEVVLVAIQNSHENFLVRLLYLQDVGGSRQPKCPDFADD
jgi:hypothetical protein